MNAFTDPVKEFILEEFLPGEDEELLSETTPLFSTGVLDSLASLQLVAFLERSFGIEVHAHEVVAENLDTLSAIASFVRKKQGVGA